MSSGDIGPALPPHMRKNHEGKGDDTKDASKIFGNMESNGKMRDEKRGNRDKYDSRYRHRIEDSAWRSRGDENRSRKLNKGRELSSREGRHEGRRQRHKRERIEERIDAEKERQVKPCKRSKRSKTDRTYNTDTEESSDEDTTDHRDYAYNKNTHFSESDQEEEGLNVKTCEEGSHEKTLVSNDIKMIGPPLPPHLLKAPANESASSSLHTFTSELVRPALPPHLLKPSVDEHSSCSPQLSTSVIVGPALPPHLLKSTASEEASSSHHSSNSKLVGPALPPHLRFPVESEDQNDTLGLTRPTFSPLLKPGNTEENPKESTNPIIGPTLPSNLTDKSLQRGLNHSPSDIGPALPPHLKLHKNSQTGPEEDSSDDEVLGPLLPEEMTKSDRNYFVQAQLERNAAAIKRKLEKKDTSESAAFSREEWMLQLPPEGSVDLGLGPRTFRARGAPEKGADRSMWTDTPADKARKEEESRRRFELGISSTEDIKKAAVSKELSSKDKSMEDAVKKHKRSKESLLDSHHKKIKEENKRKEKSGVKQERRPFSRDIDLKTNVFDDAQKKAIYKKAQLLDSRFSRGESKYL